MIPRARSSPLFVRRISSPEASTMPPSTSSSSRPSGPGSAADRNTSARLAFRSSRSVHRSSRISSCPCSVISCFLSRKGPSPGSQPSIRAWGKSIRIPGNRQACILYSWGTRTGMRGRSDRSPAGTAGIGSSCCSPVDSKCDPRPARKDVDRGADQNGEREDEQGHSDRHLYPVLLDDHKEVRKARNKKRHCDQAHHHLEVGEHPRLRHAVQSRRPIVPTQETDQERLRRLRRQVEQTDDQRFRRSLDPEQPTQPVRSEKNEGPDEEKGNRLPQVPFDPRHRFYREIPHLGPAYGGNLEDEVRRFPRDHLRCEEADGEDDPNHQSDPCDRRDRTDARQHSEDHPQLRRTGYP